MISVIDNYLEKPDFKTLEIAFTSNNIAWYYNTYVANKNEKKFKGNIYFNHTFFRQNEITSPNFHLLKPLLNKLEVKAIVNIKLNLYPQTEKVVEHNLHTDHKFPLKSALYYLNTCDGYTYFKETNEKVNSVANRIVLFDSSKEHCSTTTTNQNARFTLNINYF